MSKFKVGDKVRVVKDCKDYEYYVGDMRSFVGNGEVFTILRTDDIDDCRLNTSTSKKVEDAEDLWFPQEALELVAKFNKGDKVKIVARDPKWGGHWAARMNFHALSDHVYTVLYSNNRADGTLSVNLNTSEVEKSFWDTTTPQDWNFPGHVLELVEAKPRAVELASKEDIVKKLEELGYLDELEEALAD